MKVQKQGKIQRGKVKWQKSLSNLNIAICLLRFAI